MVHAGRDRSQRRTRGMKGCMQVMCASNTAMSPSAMRQSVSRNAHRVETAKRMGVFEKLPNSVLVDMSLLGQVENFTEGEVVQAAGRPSPGLSVLLEGGHCKSTLEVRVCCVQSASVTNQPWQSASIYALSLADMCCPWQICAVPGS